MLACSVRCTWVIGSKGRHAVCAVRWHSADVAAASSKSDPHSAVVKIFNTRQRPGWTVPWQAQPVESSSGSGALVRVADGSGGIAVLTAAHVVADNRFVQIQRSTDRFSGEKFRARVASICHEADLALLVIDEARALEGIVPLAVADADALPRVFDKVRVWGYPVGGDACSVTEGVVSRVEVQEYSHSLRAGLALTVDAAINSGNSGGPVVDTTTSCIVGVAFQKLVARGVELQGHAVPAPYIQRFLAAVDKTALAPEDIDSSRCIQRMPSLGVDFQPLEPLALRRSLSLPDSTRRGVLISRLHYNAERHATSLPPLQAGDVLLEFDGHQLDELGFCELFGRRLHFSAARDLHRIGSKVKLLVWRDGKELELEHELVPTNHLVPRGQYDGMARFFACGGLIFQPLSNEYLQGWSSTDRPAHLQHLFLGGHVTPERSEAVMLSQILADEATAGYDSGWVGAPIVRSVNGERIRDLAHLIDIVRTTKQRYAMGSGDENFLRFDVELSGGPFRIVLALDGLDDADLRISSLYGVPPAGCSEHYALSRDDV